jgi:hypothetical protein
VRDTERSAVEGALAPEASDARGGRRWRRSAALLVALVGLGVVARLVSGAAPRETRVSVGLAEHREGAARAEAVSVSFEQRGAVLHRVEARFGGESAVPARWARTLSLVPGRYRVKVEVVSARGIFTRDEEREVGPEGLDLAAPR